MGCVCGVWVSEFLDGNILSSRTGFTSDLGYRPSHLGLPALFGPFFFSHAAFSTKTCVLNVVRFCLFLRGSLVSFTSQSAVKCGEHLASTVRVFHSLLWNGPLYLEASSSLSLLRTAASPPPFALLCLVSFYSSLHLNVTSSRVSPDQARSRVLGSHRIMYLSLLAATKLQIVCFSGCLTSVSPTRLSSKTAVWPFNSYCAPGTSYRA